MHRKQLSDGREVPGGKERKAEMSDWKKMRPAESRKRNDAEEERKDAELQEKDLWDDGAEQESGDIYGIYMEELAAIPPCSERENQELLKKIRAGEEEARTRLIEGNLKQALFFVQDYINQGVPMADLIQEASMELMLLADEGFEGGFEKLLESRIRVRLEDVVKEQKKEAEIEEEILARVNVLQEVSGRMAEELGREATLAELAEKMKMTEEEVRDIMKTAMDALSVSGETRDLKS